jgi:hypothetical protein
MRKKKKNKEISELLFAFDFISAHFHFPHFYVHKNKQKIIFF